ncbi:hemerythrin domain-containing protein [Nocardioides anomalus]|uniref:Hemerythrin domain-containing protein n=1 Tax=Nocardioides anomalus TaxID=2712223 RepID=A0A6G6W8B2_9ACTN|nr:hemerythrin domain-containing protein [Nocardioides anomalus]QIG41393.1 hemerythrin domain-containing protein [Nocardioides anomalus]
MSALLPGQAAAPDGPIDLTMMYLLHHGFRRDLARFADAARRTPVAEGATWHALLERWDLFALLLEDHHTKEDDHVWPLLDAALREADDRGGLRVLEEMATEHGAIDPVLATARERLARMAARPDAVTRSALVDAVTAAREVVDQHLAHEERSAVPLLQRYVSEDDWARLDREHLRGGLAPRQLLQLVPWAVQGLHPEITAEPLRRAGFGFRVLLRLGRPRFRRLELAAFRHVGAGVGA